MLDFAVVTDAPTTLGADKQQGSWVQIAKLGRFKDPRYGTFSITTQDFDRWIENFHALHKSDGRLGLPVDVDHAPEKRGDTEAAGWITDLEKRGTELWAKVEWTSLGRELVSDRRYVYLSPSYQHDYKDESGKSHGTTLVGVALTNRPFLRMATVSLSAVPLAAEEQVETVGVTVTTTAGVTHTSTTSAAAAYSHPQTMSTFASIAKTLGLAEDADEATILAKLAERESKPTQTLAEQAQAEGKVVLDATQLAQLQADATAGAEAKAQLRKDRFDVAFSKALSEGRAVPAMREHFQKLYDADEATTLGVLESAPRILNTELQGSGSGHGEAVAPVDADGDVVDTERLELHNRALAIAAERNIDYGDAVMLAAQGV